MSRLRILLAEDDPDHQNLLVEALTGGSPGLQVQVVATGEEALQALRRSRPGGFDCVVMDYHLPDRRADDALQDLSRASNTPPVIVVSSGKSQDIVIDSLRNGSVDFVPKEEALAGDSLRQRVQFAVQRARRASRERRRIARRAERLTRLAETDPLTGLSNRRGFERMLQDPRSLLDRRGEVAAVMIDLDHFHDLNACIGHEGGDCALSLVSAAIRQALRPADLACRWGGEEFLIVRPRASLAGTVLWAEAVRKEIERCAPVAEGRCAPVTASFGVAAHSVGRPAAETIAQADRAMYLAKRLGRNRVCTEAMLVFEQLCAECAARHVGPKQRLDELLARAKLLLGPNQREHVIRHGTLVAATAATIGRELEWESDRVERLRLAGRVHDIGLFAAPDELLAVAGPLSAEERAFLDLHSAYGAEMAAHLDFELAIVESVRHHHSRYDATLEESAPPLEARIICVADAFVAMTSPCSHNPLRSVSAAVAEIQRCAGTQFDPQIAGLLPRALLHSQRA